MIERLDTALTRYAHLIARDLHVDVLDLAGGGAAGGMGAALYAFCGAQLRRGIEIVTDALHLEACLADADLVITGEGRIDSQTIHGKVPIGVANIAKRDKKPVGRIRRSRRHPANISLISSSLHARHYPSHPAAPETQAPAPLRGRRCEAVAQ